MLPASNNEKIPFWDETQVREYCADTGIDFTLSRK